MTGKQKNRALLGGILLLLFVAYQFAFKQTIALGYELSSLSKKKENALLIQDTIQLLNQENMYLDSILRSVNLSADRSFEQLFLEKIDALRDKYKVKLLSIEEPHYYRTEEATIETFQLELTGSFRNLMLFSSALEKSRLGTFSSVDFSKKKNLRTRKTEIICTIILQRLSK